MIEYIYIVKCPNCEDEHFHFFDEAKTCAMGYLSDKPIITQVEVNRNDFGECTDSTDLGTVWSWEEVMDKEPAAEPSATFTKDDLKKPEDNDPEFDDDDFYFMNNTIAEDYSRRVSFKSKAEHDEFMKLCSEIGIITGEDLDRFMVDNDVNDGNLLDKLRAYRAELGDDFELKEASLFGMPSSVAAKSRAPIDSDFIIAIKNLNDDNYSFLSKSYKITRDINNAMTYSSKFGAEDELKYAKDAVLKVSPAALDDDPTSERFSILTFGEAKNLPRYERKPIPEGMTIEQLVEEMEENEDTVECTWCNDLFDKSECRKEVNLGWLCSRCEAAIKSRGEPLTFRENNYWDFLDEDVEELHDLGIEYDGGYPNETPEALDSHLKLCPECGKETFDTETGICVTCGFN